MSISEQRPYRILGSKLKQARCQLSKSMAEVSGAVEIDLDTLEKIERGARRPAEEILLLLMTHLQIRDDEAVRMWELAGYDGNFGTVEKQITVMLPADAPVLYTDMAHVTVNNYGVVLNFLQGTGGGDQATVVARVGMSKEHAKSVIKLLSRSLDETENKPKTIKALPASTTKKNHKKSN